MNYMTTTIPYILLVLLAIFLAAEVCGYILKIRSKNFFYAFHFAGGVFICLLFYILTQNSIVSLAATFAIGILWEIYEWVLWKYFLKKKIYKPERTDTIKDIIFDMLGAVTLIFLTLAF